MEAAGRMPEIEAAAEGEAETEAAEATTGASSGSDLRLRCWGRPIVAILVILTNRRTVLGCRSVWLSLFLPSLPVCLFLSQLAGVAGDVSEAVQLMVK